MRRTLVMGLALIAGVSVDVHLAFFAGLPAEPLRSSALVLTTLAALLLNLVFRLGVRKDPDLVVEPEAVATRGGIDQIRLVPEAARLWMEAPTRPNRPLKPP